MSSVEQLELWRYPVLHYQVFPYAHHEVVPQVRQSARFHDLLGVLSFCSHMWQESHIWESQQTRIDYWFIWIDI